MSKVTTTYMDPRTIALIQANEKQLKNEASKKFFSSPDNPLEAANYSYFNGHGRFENSDTKQVYSRKNMQTPTEREQNRKLKSMIGQEITTEGKRKFQEQIDYLNDVELPKAIRLLENAESYFEKTQANQEKNRVLDKIHELNTILAVSKCSQKNPSRRIVQIGSTVTVAFLADGEQEKFRIGGPQEAAFCANTISTASPIGHALLGKRVNQQVYYDSPDGKVGVVIIKIES